MMTISPSKKLSLINDVWQVPLTELCLSYWTITHSKNCLLNWCRQKFIETDKGIKKRWCGRLCFFFIIQTTFFTEHDSLILKTVININYCWIIGANLYKIIIVACGLKFESGWVRMIVAGKWKGRTIYCKYNYYNGRQHPFLGHHIYIATHGS